MKWCDEVIEQERRVSHGVGRLWNVRKAVG